MNAGQIGHQRLTPVGNAFRYSLFFLYLDPAGEKLAVSMNNTRLEAKVFNASLQMQRQPLTGRNLAGVLLRWPFMTAKVVAAIYWQALRLKWKGVPFCAHPEQLDIRKGRYSR